MNSREGRNGIKGDQSLFKPRHDPGTVLESQGINISQNHNLKIQMEGTPFGIFNDRLVLFVHLPKAGGTAIRNAYFTGHDNHKHMPMSAIKRKWPKLYARAYKIANVRDPIERICSALRWIQTGAPKPDRLATKGMAPKQLFEYVFEQNRLTDPCARPLSY